MVVLVVTLALLFVIVIMVVVMMTVLLLIMVMVVMLMVMFAPALSILMVMVVLVIMIMAVAFLIMVVVMMLMVVIVTAAALPIFVVMVMMLMVVAVAFHMLIDLIEQSAVVDRVIHDVLELVLIDVEHRAHECEVDLLLRLEVPVLLDTVPEVCEVVCDAGSVIERDGCLDVPEHGASLLLDPFAYLEHGLREPCLGICVPASDPSGYSGCYSAGLFQ